jgi:hypothetical protein
MTIVELGEILSGMYDNASDGNQVAMTHLFGIRYSGKCPLSFQANQSLSLLSSRVLPRLCSPGGDR